MTNLDSLHNPSVNDSIQVIYQVEIQDGELYYVLVRIAEQGIFDSDSTYGSFWVYPGMAVDPGIDTMFIDFYYSTNTNSLADKVGYEAYLETMKVALDFNP